MANTVTITSVILVGLTLSGSSWGEHRYISFLYSPHLTAFEQDARATSHRRISQETIQDHAKALGILHKLANTRQLQRIITSPADVLQWQRLLAESIAKLKRAGQCNQILLSLQRAKA